MNLNAFYILHLVVSHGSMKSSANALGITPSAVTKAIRRMEAELGVKLLENSGSSVHATEIGQELAMIARQLESCQKDLQQSLDAHLGNSPRHIVLHCSESFGAYHFPEAVLHITQTLPDLHISSTNVHNDEAYSNTLARRNDLSIVSFPAEHEELLLQNLFSEEMVFIVPPGHELATKENLKPWDLHNKWMITHERGSFPWKAMKRFQEEHGFQCKERMQISSNETIRKAAQNGLGIGLVSPRVVQEDIANGSLIVLPIHSPHLVRTYYSVIRKDRLQSNALILFMKALETWISINRAPNNYT